MDVGSKAGILLSIFYGTISVFSGTKDESRGVKREQISDIGSLAKIEHEEVEDSANLWFHFYGIEPSQIRVWTCTHTNIFILRK